MAVVLADRRTPHEPVLRDRVVALLATDTPGLMIDCTIGAGGHAEAVLAASGPGLHLLGLDRDPDALVLARDRLSPYGDRVVLVHGGYDTLAEHAAPLGLPVRGVLYDLGVSSMQVDRAERGFSFRADGPLDMRMDPTTGPSAADLVNTAEQAELARIIARYGEERFAARIAAAIVRARPLHTTAALADVVAAAVPARARHASGTHPATRSFQALRIAVNRELERLEAALPQALDLLAPGGRLVVLAYHSLEDRIAKRFLSDAATGCICPPDMPVCGCGRVPLVTPLIRGAAQPSADEIARNPRARSARLRAVQRLE